MRSNIAIRVLVISPRALIRAGLVAILRGQPRIQIVGDADAPNSAAESHSDVALWDVNAAEPQAAPVKFLALLSEPRRAPGWLQMGAAGCVLDTASVEELLSGIRQVARGETFLSPMIMRDLTSLTAGRQHAEDPVDPLTEREREVLQLLSQGLSNKDIAQKLYLSVRTVEGHLASIYGKLHLRSRTEAALWSIHHA